MFRRLLLSLTVLVAIGLWPTAAQAQFRTNSGSLTAIACTTNGGDKQLGCIVLNTTGMGTATVEVSGTFTATVTFEVSGSGGVWSSINCLAPSATTPVTTATAAGNFGSCNVAGFSGFRARLTAYTSGVANVTVSASAAGGGGGTSAVDLSGGTFSGNAAASATGAAVPAAADYLGVNSAGNLVGVLLGQQTKANSLPVSLASNQDALPITDNSGSLTVDNGGTFAVQAAESGTWNITNISGTVSLPTGASSAAKQPALGTAGTAATDVLTVQGIASGTNLNVNCAVGCTGGTTDTDDGTIAGGQVTAIQNALNYWYDGSNWKRITIGTAGTASAQVLTVQGVASMTPILATLSGANVVRNADGAGNLLTSLNVGSQQALTVSVVDGSGNQITAFSGSGGTASNFGSAVPSAGTAAGFHDGTNMQLARVVDADTGGGTFYAQAMNLVKRTSGTPTELIGQATMANSLPITLASDQSAITIGNISGTVSLPTGASTAAKQPALGTAGSAASDVLTVQGVASMTPLLATVTGNLTNISGTISLPTGAATAAKQPALGTAGTAASDVITVQGIASMTALKVDGSAINQPVNITQVAGASVGTVISGVQKVGTADSSGTAFLSAANALNSTGAGVAAAQAVGQFDDTSPTAITENQFGNLRMSANRNLYGTLRDAAGNERGANVNGSNQLSVSVDNTVTVGSHAVTNAGTFAVQAAESGTWTVQPGNTANTTAWLMAGGKTNNNAAPGATNLGVLGALANAAAPAWTEGDLVANSVDLHGSQRVTLLDSAGTAATLATDYTQDAALTVATTTGPVIMGRASAAAPTNVSADDDAVMEWHLRNGSNVANIAAGSTLITATSTSLNVNCTGGCSSSSVADEAAFTQGTSSYQAIGGTYNTSITNLTSGQGGSVQLTTDRMLFTNLGKVGGTAVVTGGTAGSLGVGGTVAHDGAGGSVNPVLAGCYASQAAPSDVSADADATRLWCLRNGSVVANLAAGGTLITATSSSLNTNVTNTTLAVTKSGTWDITNAGTFAVQPAGSVAHDGAAAAVNPNLLGFYASAAAPSDVSADNDSVRGWALRNGAQVVNLSAAGTLITATTGKLDVQCANCTGSGVSVNEDVASANADPGTPAYAIRTATIPVDKSAGATNGDYEPLQVDGIGRLYVNSSPYDATGTPFATSSNPYVTQLAASQYTGGQEDNGASASGQLDMMGAVRRDAALSSSTSDGDNSNVNTDALGLLWTRELDPCSGTAKLYLPISIVTATTTEITPSLAGASTHYYICALNLVTAAANNVLVADDNTDNCVSPTAGIFGSDGSPTAGEGWNLAANGGIAMGNGNGSVGRTQTANAVICIITSAATQLSGMLVVAAAP